MSALRAADLQTPLARLLRAPRYEVIPVKGIEDKVAALPRGATVTVTASPSHGFERTLEVSEHLAASGFDVVPHFSARMIAGEQALAAAVSRMRAVGISEAFVVGGDAAPSADDFYDAGRLLEALAELPDRFSRIGVGGYPEGHPTIPTDKLRAALLHKQRFADYVATQICFDAGVLQAWIEEMRGSGCACRWSRASPASSTGRGWRRSRCRPGSARRYGIS